MRQINGHKADKETKRLKRKIKQQKRGKNYHTETQNDYIYTQNT